jgi:hypothetical protein
VFWIPFIVVICDNYCPFGFSVVLQILCCMSREHSLSHQTITIHGDIRTKKNNLKNKKISKVYVFVGIKTREKTFVLEVI